MEAAERLSAKLTSDGDCLIWRGYTLPKGYGLISYQGKPMQTHRLAWKLAFGEIPPEMHVLHTCDNPPCCNPEHLFLGTNQDNIDDKMRKGRHNNGMSERTHCIRNHEYTESNTYYTPSGARQCKACRRQRDRERYSKA